MPHPLRPTPEKYCLYCEKKMERKRYHSGTLEAVFHFKRRKFCGQLCMAMWMEGRVKKQNPKNSRRQSVKCRTQRCENCGTPQKLGVHHKDSNPENNDPANLMTLCSRCHMQIHWQEWKKTKRPPKCCRICGEPARKHMMCQKHFQRWKRHGDPYLVKRNSPSGFVLVKVDS